ncbi:hypothetical protein DFA_03443 [Cavenderia fasciculata]|uniref:Uncharacterized protein n=1 Tax=Cavenderia fasciculata TaxID=261658 RepID=F4PHL1_CACFS|nr:uncharacterized protein DFA_03443 [Cavenderia fasciculata]EGG25195.1 hypothetical protein DFA_03443 [Cavenderia fasciculata]|eukprot:XP_004363046.1 hypothetical protein DFA_03443 [Cavenderia fasciculata]
MLDKLTVLFVDPHITQFQESVRALIKSGTNRDPDTLDFSGINDSEPTSATNTSKHVHVKEEYGTQYENIVGFPQNNKSTTTTTPTKKTPVKGGLKTPTKTTKSPSTPSSSAKKPKKDMFGGSTDTCGSQGDGDVVVDKKGRVNYDINKKAKYDPSSLKAFFQNQKKLFDTVETINKTYEHQQNEKPIVETTFTPIKSQQSNNNNNKNGNGISQSINDHNNGGFGGDDEQISVRQILSSKLNVNNNNNNSPKHQRLNNIPSQQQQQQQKTVSSQESDDEEFKNWGPFKFRGASEFQQSIDKPSKKTVRSILKKRDQHDMLETATTNATTAIKQPTKRVRFHSSGYTPPPVHFY